MFVRWQSYKSVAWWHGVDKPITRWKAVLVESARVNGKPRQKYIACLASIDAEQIQTVNARCRFWCAATMRLDTLGNRASTQQRAEIEDALARKVSRPTQAQFEKYAAETAAFRRAYPYLH